MAGGGWRVGAVGAEVRGWSRGGALRAQFTLPGPMTSLAVSPDGGRLFVGLRDVTVLCDREGNTIKRFVGQSRGGRFMTFAPDGESVYGIGVDGVAQRWNLAHGPLKQRRTPGAWAPQHPTPP